MTRRRDDADAACPPTASATGDASRPPSGPAAGSAEAAEATGRAPATGADREGTTASAPSSAAPEGPGEQPAWPPLVHAPDVDRETLLRRICGG